MRELPGTLVELQRELRRGTLTRREALDAQRTRLRTLDATLHAVVDEWPSDDSAFDAWNVLSGIGLAHKDIFDLAGRRPGLGVDHGAAVDNLPEAAALLRLRRHGAVDLATLAMAPYACGATADAHAAKRCVNPLLATAVVGGSSSGSAVAVASGMVYASLGTDTAGSVRIPAATCGVLGLKTTHGLVSTDGVHPLAPTLDSVGIMARCADDLEQILAVVAPRAAASSTGAVNAQPRRDVATAAPRVKAWLPERALHADVATAIEALAGALNANVLPGAWGDHRTLSDLGEIVLRSEAARTHRQALVDSSASPAVEAIALAGLMMSPGWHAGALAERGLRAAAFVRDHLTMHDVFLAPALGSPIPDWDQVVPGAPGFDGKELLGLHRFMGFVNYLGLPSLSIPVALDRRGLPISVQLIARPFHEHLLLGLARRIESTCFRFDAPDTAHVTAHVTAQHQD